ncbi:MAG: DUF2282 domain-containing protein [Rhodospirillaceae bacterium]
MAKTLTLGTVALSAAFAGAAAVAASPPATAGEVSMEKCYGVAKPGENGCAHAKGLHSCAGNSSFTFDGGDWKMVPAGTCVKVNGSLAPFEGVNPRKKA